MTELAEQYRIVLNGGPLDQATHTTNQLPDVLYALEWPASHMTKFRADYNENPDCGIQGWGIHQYVRQQTDQPVGPTTYTYRRHGVSSRWIPFRAILGVGL
ncbi:hypothetical protein [Allonocardiopsis opalescens]|uniref:Uncharacterized protein n=1 Tax=Allonocardiopsis opalescens TaxID=1144618 RepID=A0A2T0PSV2_9ACTN|nr:hypothetical protein [Allonocardiopsis opalescens]PRX91972.1 hypothetical protein CLV72_11245 [Allonocardiopsis opalescens]